MTSSPTPRIHIVTYSQITNQNSYTKKSQNHKLHRPDIFPLLLHIFKRHNNFYPLLPQAGIELEDMDGNPTTS